MAVLGSERAGTLLPTLGALQAILSKRVEQDTPERRLLTYAAAISVYMRAGWSAPAAPGQLGGVADAETFRSCGLKAGRCLGRILLGEYRDLLSEWCHAAAEHGVRAPDELLPQLLDRIAALRNKAEPAMREVLGERGRWLAARKPEWAAFGRPNEDDAETVWQTGTRDQRIELLGSLRTSDPGAARAMLASTWAQEDPEDRAAFAQALYVGLSLDDEPFLEELLDDSRKPVRTVAAELLARLPHSMLAERMKARVLPLVQFQPASKGLLRSRKAGIEVSLPEACDKTMIRDGIDSRARPKMGPKAYWLCQVIGAAPLKTWTDAWKANPATIVDAASRSDFPDALIQGWMLATVRHRDPQWAEAILGCGYMVQADEKAFVGNRADRIEGLMCCLYATVRERILAAMLSSRPFPLDTHPVLVLLCAAAGPWSPVLSRKVLDAFRTHYARHSNGYDYELRRVLAKEFAMRLDPGVADKAGQGWPTGASNWNQGNEDMVSELVATLQFRREYLEDLKT